MRLLIFPVQWIGRRRWPGSIDFKGRWFFLGAFKLGLRGRLLRVFTDKRESDRLVFFFLI